jgi:hypothetical protein
MPPLRSAQPVNRSVVASAIPIPPPAPRKPFTLPPLHPQPTAKRPPKKQKLERKVVVFKGMSTAVIMEDLTKEDIRQALFRLNKASSKNSKEVMADLLTKGTSETQSQPQISRLTETRHTLNLVIHSFQSIPW